MKTHVIFAALLAVAIAKDLGNREEDKIEELEAAASVELLRTDREAKEDLDEAASNNYVPPSQRPPRPWNTNNNQYYVPNNQNYVPNVPQNYVPNNQQNLGPSSSQNYFPNNPQATWTNQQNNLPTPGSLNNYNPNQNPNIIPSPPQNNYVPNYQPTVPQYNPLPSNPVPSNPAPVHNVPTTPQNPQAPQNDYYVPQNSWTTTATPVATVIKNDQYIGENGNYKYEYQINDGTHVSEEGYLTNPNTENEKVVKKGWYSYPGADGRIYTVTWWADESGFHAFGDHLPTPPPVPPAIQAALDQAEAEKNKPQQGYYPQSTTPATYYPQPQPTQPTYYPQNNYPQQTYPQQQQTYYPPSYGK